MGGEPDSPSVVVSQKMTAGKRALAARSPVSRILRENGLVESTSAKARTPRKESNAQTSDKVGKRATKKETPRKQPSPHAEDATELKKTTEQSRKKTKIETGAVENPVEKKRGSKRGKKDNVKEELKGTTDENDGASAPDQGTKTEGVAPVSAKRLRFSSDTDKVPTHISDVRAKRKARKRAAASKEQENRPTTEHSKVIYIGHIPHGFYERQMRSYFKQFGNVTQLKLSRSKRTGESRGFAFVEFESAEVASKAAEAMDGYMMHGRRLKASVVSRPLHAKTFAGARRKFQKVDWAARDRHAAVARSQAAGGVYKANRAITKAHTLRMKRLASLGVHYKMPRVGASAAVSDDS